MPFGTIAAWTAVAIAGAKAGSSIVGAKTAAGGAKSAARTQAAAAQRAAEIEANATREALEYTKEQDRLQRQDWERREQRITPYRQGGQQAVRTMGSLMPGPARGPGGPGQLPPRPYRPLGGEIGLHRRLNPDGTAPSPDWNPTPKYRPLGGEIGLHRRVRPPAPTRPLGTPPPRGRMYQR